MPRARRRTSTRRLTGRGPRRRLPLDAGTRVQALPCPTAVRSPDVREAPRSASTTPASTTLLDRCGVNGPHGATTAVGAWAATPNRAALTHRMAASLGPSARAAGSSSPAAARRNGSANLARACPAGPVRPRRGGSTRSPPLTSATPALHPAPRAGPWAGRPADSAGRRIWPWMVAAGGLSVPTRLYGHEPANLFAGGIAKYFPTRSEDTLLRLARGGVVRPAGRALCRRCSRRPPGVLLRRRRQRSAVFLGRCSDRQVPGGSLLHRRRPPAAGRRQPHSLTDIFRRVSASPGG